LQPESVSTKQGRIAMLPSVHSAICGRVWADESPLAGGRNGCPKNRMPELGSSGSVRGEGSNALTYSECNACAVVMPALHHRDLTGFARGC